MMYTTMLEMGLAPIQWTFDAESRKAAETQTREIARALYALGWPPAGLPSRIKVDDQKVAVRDDWFERYWKPARHDADAWWPDDQSSMVMNIGAGIVGLTHVAARFNPRQLADGLATIPFTTVVFGHVFQGYKGPWPDGFFTTAGLVGPTGSMGFGLAVRGDGHHVFVSRRWLTHGGPWRVLTGANDTTMVQLYDLGAKTPDIAWSQAKDSYARLTSQYNGSTGFVWFRDKSSNPLPKDAQYDATTKTVWVVAGDRNVSTDEMRNVAEDRFNGTLKPATLWRPVATTAYVFSSEERAKQHLHELWLRDHQVWYERGGTRTRIDDKYDPKPPAPPAWIAEAEAREAKPDTDEPAPTVKPPAASPHHEDIESDELSESAELDGGDQ